MPFKVGDVCSASRGGINYGIGVVIRVKSSDPRENMIYGPGITVPEYVILLKESLDTETFNDRDLRLTTSSQFTEGDLVSYVDDAGSQFKGTLKRPSYNESKELCWDVDGLNVLPIRLTMVRSAADRAADSARDNIKPVGSHADLWRALGQLADRLQSSGC